MRPETSRELQGPTWDDSNRQRRAHAEHEAVCERLRVRVLGGVMPPDEAYWWARIAAEEAAALACDARQPA